MFHATPDPSIFESLTEEERIYVQALAVFHEPTTRTAVISVLTRLGVRNGTRAHNATTVQPVLEKLTRAGILVGDQHWRVPPGLAHCAAMMAVSSGRFAAIAEAVRKTRPLRGSSGSPTNFMDAVRELRIELYLRRWDAARQLTKRVQDSAFAEICQPFDGAWLLSLPADIRRIALVGILDASERDLTPAPGALDLLERESPAELSDGQHHLLIHQLVLRGRLQDAERLLAYRTSVQAEVARAWLMALRGEGPRALTAYESALTSYLKHSGTRARFFPDVAGVFFVVALIRDGRPECLKRAQVLSDSARSPSISGSSHAYEILLDVVRLLTGESEPDDVVDLARRSGRKELRPVEKLVDVLALTWVGQAIRDEQAAEMSRQVFQAAEAGYEWLAAHGADALVHLGHADSKERLDALRASVAGHSLVGRVRKDENWSTALDALLAVVAPEKRAATAPVPEHGHRLVWLVAGHEGWLVAEPREQTRSKNGWSKGRPVALKRLYDDAKAMPFLTEQDRAVCHAITQQISTRYYGRYQDISYALDPEQSWQALIGAPNVVTEVKNELVPVEVRASQPRLRVERVASGLRVTMVPAPRSLAELSDTSWSGPNLLVVVTFHPSHHAIAKALGKKGLEVPASAMPRVREVLAALSGVVAAEAHFGDEPDADAVTGDVTPHLSLRRVGEGISVEPIVRPLGHGGPSLHPGSGGTTVLGTLEGRPARAARNLQEESRRLHKVLAACPTLTSAEATPAGFVVRDRERALEVICEVNALSGVPVEWPGGEVLETLTLSPDNLRVTVHGTGGEFLVDGAVQLGNGAGPAAIELAELLDYLSVSPGRFFQATQHGPYFALAADFRRRLGELRALSSGRGRILSFHPLMLPQVEELLAGTQVTADVSWQQQVARLTSEGSDPDVPPTFRGELRPYQVEGFRWLARLGRWGVGGCLADDMGLGKTVQAIALLLLRAPQGPSLVVAPTSVVSNWADEIARFAPTLNVRAYAGDARQSVLAQAAPFDVVIASYSALRQDGEALAGVRFEVALLDEAQAVKNAQTQRAQAACALDAGLRIAMTGTPVENRLEDLWSIFRFLNPGLLGSAESFAERFVRTADVGARASLRRIVAPFVLRRTKTEVLAELPARTEVTLRIELEMEHVALYDAIRSEALGVLPAAVESSGRRMQILAAIMKLRRVACHARLVLPASDVPSAKLAALGDLLDELLPNRHRVLVFSQFTDHLALVRELLVERGVTYQYLDGSTPPPQRKAAIAAFQAGAGEVFLISLRAGGFGINLTAADYVVHMDPWWNPAVEAQASDRAHRIGQTRPVTIYRLVARDTIEDRILDLHHRKRELATSLLEGGDATGRMSEAELLQLIRGT